MSDKSAIDSFVDVDQSLENKEQSSQMDFDQIQQKIKSAVSPLGDKDKEDITDSDIDKFVSAIDSLELDQDKKNQLQKKIRVARIKKSKNIEENAAKFLMEISGVQPYRSTKKPISIMEVEFEALKSRDIESLVIQAQRDVAYRRSRFSGVDGIVPYYRAAMSVRSINISDPQTKQTHISVLFPSSDETKEESKFIKDNPEVNDFDSVPRIRYLYLRDVILKGGSSFELFMRSFTEFEQELFDLQFLLAEDPDFFQ